MVSIRLARGTMERGSCDVCGCDDVQAHHDDYSKPLDIRWLCKEHHMIEHERMNRVA